MARRIQFMGKKLIESEGGIGWEVNRETGDYETEFLGIQYQLEFRRRSRVERGSDTGWHLYSRGVTYFFGEWCGRRLLDAIDEASNLINKADLRGEGYEKREDAVKGRSPEVLDAWLRTQATDAEVLALYRWVTQHSLREHRDHLRASVARDGDLYTAAEQEVMLKMADELDVDAVQDGALIRCLPLTLWLSGEEHERKGTNP